MLVYRKAVQDKVNELNLKLYRTSVKDDVVFCPSVGVRGDNGAFGEDECCIVLKNLQDGMHDAPSLSSPSL